MFKYHKTNRGVEERMKELLKSWINSYEKDSSTYRVLIGKSGNILKLMRQAKQETLKEVYESACNCVTIEGFCGLMERNYKKELKKK